VKKLLILGIAATVLNALVVWVLTHFLIVVLGAASWCPDPLESVSHIFSDNFEMAHSHHV